MPTKKKVSIFWQCLATLFFPTGLYAFKRINKFRVGLLIYFITIGLTYLAPLGTGHMWYDFNYDLYLVTYAVFTLVAIASLFIFPILYIRKWSNEWNESVDRENAS